MNSTLTPDEIRVIAKDAYVYGFPMVDGYRIINSYFVDKSSKDYKVPFNEIANFARVFTPADTVVQTPNSDTPYSFVGLDLRAEPVVLTVPPIDKKRYFSIQLSDAYTFNFAYIGSRATGSEGGVFMIVGPGWQGSAPLGITKVIQSETELVSAIYRTQLFDAGDIENVKAVQAGLKAQTLSAFLGKPAPQSPSTVEFRKPLTPDEQKTSLEFFNQLIFVLQFAPTVPEETALRAKFAGIGIEPGKEIDFASMSPENRAAYEGGMADAWASFNEFVVAKFRTGKVTANDVFGTRAFLNGNYLYRMAAAVLGIYGNSAEEAMYPSYTLDSDGKLLDGKNRYTLHFADGALPPAHAFWSLTMYKQPSSLLVDNPINRYLVNSPMLPSFKRDAAGGITIYVQHESPGADLEPNWLPAPEGPFSIFMRIYWPEAAALDGTWQPPPMLSVH